MSDVIVALDVETTGLSVARDDITQIGICVQSRAGEPLGEYESLVRADPRSPALDRVVIELTGIKPVDLVSAPTFKQVLSDITVFLDNVCPDQAPRLLLAHNGDGFDVPMIVQNIRRRLSIDDPMSILRTWKIEGCIDTLRVCRTELQSIRCQLPRNKRGLPSFKLVDIYKTTMGKPLSGAHTALCDARALCELVCGTDMGRAWPLSTYQNTLVKYCMLRSKKRRASASIRDIVQKQKKRRHNPTSHDEPGAVCGAADRHGAHVGDQGAPTTVPLA